MRKLAIAVVATGLLGLGALAVPVRATGAGTLTRRTLPAAADGSYPTRDYLTYLPPTMRPAGQRSLVVFLHGCTQTADDAAKGTGWDELADQRGFVVAYPEQRVPPPGGTDIDGNAARCWNNGQPAVFPRGQGELESIAQITRKVMADNGIDPSHVFIAGLSAGALMSNVMAATYPDLYAAMASIEGCGYICSDPTGDQTYRRMGPYARVMPAFITQGTADYLTNPAMGETTVTQWVGVADLADDGLHNNSISLVPTSVENRDVDQLTVVDPGSSETCLHDFPRNPCPLGATGMKTYPTTIRRYGENTGSVVVESWTIHGLSHNYPGGSVDGSFTDPHGPNVTLAVDDFFEAHPMP